MISLGRGYHEPLWVVLESARAPGVRLALCIGFEHLPEEAGQRV